MIDLCYFASHKRTLFAIEMGVLNDEKYESILKASRSEFIAKGFKDASMRVIAKNANVSLSNIYNYFKNKDEIFLAIVQPAKNDIYTFIENQHNEENFDINHVSSFAYQHEMIDMYISLIFRYKEEIRLMLFHSEGSSISNFRDTLTDYMTQVNDNHMKIVKRNYPHAKDISVFFVHTLSSWMVTVVGEIVTHKLSRNKVREFFIEYFRFEIAGWRELIEI